MNCKNCGAEIKDGFLFCMSCGTKVEVTDNGASAVDESELDKTVGVNMGSRAAEEVIPPTVEAVEETAPQPVEEVAEPVSEPVLGADSEKTLSFFAEKSPEEDDGEKTLNVYGINGGVEPQPIQQAQPLYQEPQPQYQPPQYDAPQYQQTWEQPVPQKKKKKGGLVIAIISVILALGVVGVLLCASFSPIQVISSQNSPVQDLIDAYVKGETDGYVLEKTVTYTSTYEGTDEESIKEYTYAYGAYDFETATREFEMYKRTYDDGEAYVYYETPDYYYYDRLYIDSYYDAYSYHSGYLEKQENHDKAELLRALSAKNYKELAAYLNRNLGIGILDMYGYPIFDESGFDKCVRKLNRELKDEDYFNEIFGYEKYKSGKDVTYSFDFDVIDVMEWLCSVIEENPDAFTSEEAQALVLEYISQAIDDFKEYYKTYRIVYEVEIEDGYIVSSTEETICETEDGDKHTSKTVCKYSDHGEASADREVLSSFKSYKSQLGSNQEIKWNDDGIKIYDKDGNRVYD